MATKLLISIVWLFCGAAWFAFAIFLIGFSQAGAGVGPRYDGLAMLRAMVWLFLPPAVALLAALSPYDFFPRKALTFACWPWSMFLFVISGIIAYVVGT